jgi:hypothetical protein
MSASQNVEKRPTVAALLHRAAGLPQAMAVASQVTMTVVLAATAFAIPAAAQPAQPIEETPSGADGQSCSYTLSPPTVTQLPGGASAVTASLAAATCSGIAQPVFNRVCVDSPARAGDCGKNYGWSAAQVVVAFAPAGGTFTATGQGCYRLATTELTCTASGPVSSTLRG